MTTSSGRASTEARFEVSEAINDSAEVVPEDSPILDALEQYAQFVDELFDVKHRRIIFCEETSNRTAIRSVRRILREWDRAYNPNRPPSALIVRLARRLPAVFADVAGRPKKILQRRRAMEPVHRLKELDSSCVRWLTRQPGNTLAEKSGHRRAVLAVQRFESVDTLENRVVRDLLRRCCALASSYLRQHQSKFPNHEWIRMTSEFLKLCRRLESLPQLQEVSNLPSLPKPNYVLLHEARYKEIWRSYMEVIRQQRRRQHLWTWRHEAFAEMVTVAWMSSASRLMDGSNCRKFAHRHDLRIRETASRGLFFDWTSFPPIWEVSPGLSLFIGPSVSLASLPTARQIEFGGGQGFCLASWSASITLAKYIQIQFPGENTQQEANSRTPENHAQIILTDLGSAPQDCAKVDRLVVPLAMIENPKTLDPFIARWCLP